MSALPRSADGIYLQVAPYLRAPTNFVLVENLRKSLSMALRYDAPHASSAFRSQDVVMTNAFLSYAGLDRSCNMKSALYFPTLRLYVKRASTRGSICARCLRHGKAGSHASSALRRISSTGKTRQQLAPAMEQLRAPLSRKNNSTLYTSLRICQYQ